jgi:hypothetical protein
MTLQTSIAYWSTSVHSQISKRFTLLDYALHPTKQKTILVNLGMRGIALGQWQWIPPITTIIRRGGLNHA